MNRHNRETLNVLLATVAILLLIYYLVVEHITLPKEIADSPATQARLSPTEERAHQLYYSDYEQPQPQLRTFDPNTADSTTLLSLGLPPHIVRSIYKYRAKGGVYSLAEDFARVPHLTQKQYKTLRPYITISDDYKPASLLVGKRGYSDNSPHDSTVFAKKITSAERISVNDADTNALKRVPGIGSYYANQIVDLRERFGGFVSLDQLLRINHFPEEALEYLVVPDGGIRKTNVNTADFKQLSRHPYIGYSRSKSIVEYRKLVGKITSLRQLSRLEGFSESEISRLEPYVEY